MSSNFNSKKYWEERYNKGGNSGAGSYNEFANFKSMTINNFIKNNNIDSIIDFGVGDGNLLKLIDTSNKKYTGIDVSETVINKCKQIFSGDNTKKFILNSEKNNIKADLVISCDVIYHLVEENIYNGYLKDLFNMSNKYVMIYAPNINYNETIHVKKREFIEYIFNHYPKYNLIKRINRKQGSPFYIFQNNDTYQPIIPKILLQVSKNKVDDNIKNKILGVLNNYEYKWFDDNKMIEYLQKNKLEEFPNIINKIRSLKKGQHKADLFRYYFLYLNGGIFMDDDLMIEYSPDFKDYTFISVKSYHTIYNSVFNGFIACSKFNPIIYKALKHAYNVNNSILDKDYHLLCKYLFKCCTNLKKNQKVLLYNEIKDKHFKQGVKTYYNNKHILTHWCYTKKVDIKN